MIPTKVSGKFLWRVDYNERGDGRLCGSCNRSEGEERGWRLELQFALVVEGGPFVRNSTESLGPMGPRLVIG